MAQFSPISTVQGWTSVFPKFSLFDSISFYIVYIAWALVKNASAAEQEAAAPCDSCPHSQRLWLYDRGRPAHGKIVNGPHILVVSLFRRQIGPTWKRPASTGKASHVTVFRKTCGANSRHICFAFCACIPRVHELFYYSRM